MLMNTQYLAAPTAEKSLDRTAEALSSFDWESLITTDRPAAPATDSDQDRVVLKRGPSMMVSVPRLPLPEDDRAAAPAQASPSAWPSPRASWRRSPASTTSTTCSSACSAAPARSSPKPLPISRETAGRSTKPRPDTNHKPRSSVLHQ